MSGSGRAEDVVFRREEGEPRSAATTRGLVGRGAQLVVAVAALAMVPLIAWLMRDDPREAGLRPYGEDVAGLGEAGGGADVLCVIAALIVLPIGKKKSATLAGAAA